MASKVLQEVQQVLGLRVWNGTSSTGVFGSSDSGTVLAVLALGKQAYLDLLIFQMGMVFMAMLPVNLLLASSASGVFMIFLRSARG